MPTPILSITLPGPRNPDGTEAKPLYDNGSGEPAEEAIADFARWCMSRGIAGTFVVPVRNALPNLRVTVEGFVCTGCLGNGDEEQWVNRGCAPGEERFRTLTCPCCKGEGTLDTEDEAMRHEEGSSCCMPEGRG